MIKNKCAKIFVVALVCVMLFTTAPEVFAAIVETVVEPTLAYDEVYSFFDRDYVAKVKKGGKYGFVDQTGQLVSGLDYDEVGDFSEGLSWVKKAGKWGIIDKNGQLVTACQYEYDSVLEFNNGLAIVSRAGRYGYININCEIVIPLEYDSVGWFIEGLAAVEKNGKCGFIDTSGKTVIPLEYDYADWFIEGLAAVGKNGKYGFIDTSGKIVLPLEYDYAGWFIDGLAIVGKNGKYGFIDAGGKIVIPLEYDDIDWFSEGLAAVEKNGKWGYIDTSGKIVIPPQYDYTDWFIDGLAIVEKAGKYGYIDISGKIVLPLEYDSIDWFSDGLAVIEKNGKYGFIDPSGKMVVPLEYDNVFSFTEGLARIEKSGNGYGYIDTNGNVIVKPQFNSASHFFNGIALVTKDGKYGLIDADGEFAIPCDYDAIVTSSAIVEYKDDHIRCYHGYNYSENPSDLAWVLKDGKWGIVRLSEEEVPLPFTDVSEGIWYYGPVKFVYSNGLFAGTGLTEFEPETTMTREMFVTVLARLAENMGEDTGGYTLTFSDVKSGEWYSEAIAWGAAKGLVEGYNATTFGFGDKITREQMAALFIRFAEYAKITLGDSATVNFTDAQTVSNWAKNQVELCAKAGLIRGYTDGTFRPRGTATRAEVAQVFMNFVTKYVK